MTISTVTATGLEQEIANAWRRLVDAEAAAETARDRYTASLFAPAESRPDRKTIDGLAEAFQIAQDKLARAQRTLAGLTDLRKEQTSVEAEAAYTAAAEQRRTLAKDAGAALQAVTAAATALHAAQARLEAVMASDRDAYVGQSYAASILGPAYYVAPQLVALGIVGQMAGGGMDLWPASLERDRVDVAEAVRVRK